MRISTRGVKAPLGPFWSLVKCAFLFLVPWLSGVHGQSAPTKKPHIVMIVADDLGWDDVSFHGSPQIPTPTIDSLANSGVVLNNYYVSPMDTPTRASFMTGKYPIHLGLQHDTIHDRQPMGVPLGERFLPDHLKQLEYTTHAVGKWQLGFFAKEYTPTYRGFDSFYGFWTSAEDYFSHVAHDEGYGVDLRRNLEVAENQTGVYGTDLFTQEAVKVITEHKDTKPLFLYLAQQAVHVGNMDNPLQAPQQYLDKFHYIADERRRTYAGMVAALDDSVRQVVEALKSKGLYENSIIVFTTDNGAAAGGLDQSAGSNFPLRGVKNTLWEGGVRAVGFVHSPLIKNKGRVSDALIDASDWLPTLYTLAGGDPKSLGQIDGYNVWESISTGAASPRYELLHGLDTLKGKRSALRMGDYKIVASQALSFFSDWYPRPSRLHELDDLPKPTAFNDSIIDCTIRHPHPLLYTHAPVCNPTKKACLFNIKWDPCEYHNLADFMPNTLKVMKSRLEFYLKGAKPAIYPQADEVANPDSNGGIWLPWRQDPSIPPTVSDFVYPFSYDDTSVDSAGKPVNKKLSKFMSDQLHAPPVRNFSSMPTVEDIIINFANSSTSGRNAIAATAKDHGDSSQKAWLPTMATVSTATTATTAATQSTPTTATTPTSAATLKTAATASTAAKAQQKDHMHSIPTTPPKMSDLQHLTKPPLNVHKAQVQQNAPQTAYKAYKPTKPPQTQHNPLVNTKPPFGNLLHTKAAPHAKAWVNTTPAQHDVQAPTSRKAIVQTTPPQKAWVRTEPPAKATGLKDKHKTPLRPTAGQNQTGQAGTITAHEIEKLVGHTASRMSSQPDVFRNRVQPKPLPVKLTPTSHVIKAQPLPGLKPAGAVPDALQDVLRHQGFTKHSSSSQMHEVSSVVSNLHPFKPAHKLHHRLKIPLHPHKNAFDSIPEVLDIIDKSEARGNAFASESSGQKEIPTIFDIIDEAHNEKGNVKELSAYKEGPTATSKQPLSSKDFGSGMGVGLTGLPQGVSVFGTLGDKLLTKKKEAEAKNRENVAEKDESMEKEKVHKFIGHITIDGKQYYVIGTESEELDSIHTKVDGNRITLHLPKSSKLNDQQENGGKHVGGKSKSEIVKTNSPKHSEITDYIDDDDEDDNHKPLNKTLAAHNVTAIPSGNSTKCEKVVELDTSDNAVVVSSVVIVVIASAMVVGIAVVAMVAVVARHCQHARS